jgi:1,4-alpha-glucan branching enzyme
VDQRPLSQNVLGHRRGRDVFNEGTHLRLYEKLGAHRVEACGVWGAYFAVWAPNAREVSVVGDFNGWDRAAHRLAPRGVSGIWEGFAPGVEQGARSKYWIVSQHNGYAIAAWPPGWDSFIFNYGRDEVRSFGYKWDTGWMHDTLSYMRQDPIHRKHHHNQITFRSVYAFSENFVLPLSHDEVVHGKRSLLDQMPGDDWQKFANLRLLFGYMWSLNLTLPPLAIMFLKRRDG